MVDDSIWANLSGPAKEPRIVRCRFERSNRHSNGWAKASSPPDPRRDCGTSGDHRVWRPISAPRRSALSCTMMYSSELSMSLEQIRALVTADFEAVDRVVKRRLHSPVTLVDQVADLHHLRRRKAPAPPFGAAGRTRVRAPGRTTHRGGGHHRVHSYRHACCTTMWWMAPPCAAGRDTANEVFGNPTSVLVGDFLYSRAFQMMVALDRMRIMHIIADATNAIAEGEVLQLMNARDPNTSEATLHRRDPPQNRAPVSGRSANRRRSLRRPADHRRRRSPATANTSAPLFSSWTTRSIIRLRKPASGNIWERTWRRANPLSR